MTNPAKKKVKKDAWWKFVSKFSIKSCKIEQMMNTIKNPVMLMPALTIQERVGCVKNIPVI